MANNTTSIKHQQPLKDNIAIVTGGGKGLGKSITIALLAQGMKVAICGRNIDTITKTVEELSILYPKHIIGTSCDVSQGDQVTKFHQFVEQHFGSADTIINNCGFGKQSLIWETSESDWDSVMDTNVKGVYLICKAFLPAMIKKQDGFIINIASQAALNGYANAGVYCASKFAMVGLGKALQEEVKPYNIHVHSLNPALIQSQKTLDEPIDSGLIQNQDIAEMICYLLRQPRRLKIDNIGMWGF